MENITEKVIEYKKTSNKKLLEDILKLLQITIKDKTDFIFFKKWYPYNMYIKCKYCQKCKFNDIEELKKRKICEECRDCICDRGYFNLKINNLCDREDVEQELILEIMRLIINFDIKYGEFNSYLFSSLWNWCPNFITLDFVENIKHHSLYKQNEENEEIILNKEDEISQKEIRANLYVEDIFNECKTENEKKICELLLYNPQLTTRELGKKMGMTHQYISLIFKELRKRLKKHLPK